jgi:hypothetical protein
LLLACGVPTQSPIESRRRPWHYQLDLARHREIEGLLIERVRRHAQQQAQIVDLDFRNCQDVPTTDVLDGRCLRARFVFTRHQGIATIECLRSSVAGREYSANLINVQTPGDRLVRLLVGIAHNRDEELALDPAFIWPL